MPPPPPNSPRNSPPKPGIPYVVEADDVIRPLLPGYLARRRDDLQRIVESLGSGDFAALRVIGHDLKGSGLAYRIPPVSEIGAQLEQAALAKDVASIRQLHDELEQLLGSIIIGKGSGHF